MQSFIETQFPIARLSAESYIERMSGRSQLLPRLGKWWGRKPLVLVRASILGMLMPVSSNQKKDRDIFLKILTMDDEGVWDRCKSSVKKKTTREDFDAKPYADRISDCHRPENSNGPSARAWTEINTHLGTGATSLPELINELGNKRFRRKPRVGDSFCGGGSIPFEAARIGCESYGSDLNPIAGLLTWASLNILGEGLSSQGSVTEIQNAIFEMANKKIIEWGIETNKKGERSDAYLYCVEVKPEGCDYYIPLAPNWIISEKYKIVAKWHKKIENERLELEVVSVSDEEFKSYKANKGATVASSRVIDPFDPNRSWSIEALRGTNGLRRWDRTEITSASNDVFHDRLYCIRWVDSQGNRRYSAPDLDDLSNEQKVLDLLKENFSTWQKMGFIPSMSIASGYNTDQPMRERGWTHWHQMFNPRQLLLAGVIAEAGENLKEKKEIVVHQLLRGRLANYNSKLSRWKPRDGGGIGGILDTFSNQALNTLFNYATRSCANIQSLFIKTDSENYSKLGFVQLSDARDLNVSCDLWLTDPPYADAVNYHELADFFLAWYEKSITKAFPEWLPDGRAELAVRGDGDDFRRSMVDIYRNLVKNMPDNGMQMVMFTHQDPSVWADLGMILWAAGLKATAAWTISTETEAGGIKKGNYVQGTVCLVLRKRISNEPGFLDEVYPLVEDEVKRQIASMQALDDGDEPNFNDSDYQLAAYAAALKVLTQYGNLDGKDVEHEVFAVRDKNQKSDFQIVIERALGIACDTLIPRGLDHVWRDLTLVERYFLRALDIESRGERRQGMYEELARGFGITDIKPLLKSDKANGARMYTPSGLGSSLLGPMASTLSIDSIPAIRGRAGSGVTHPFALSALRHLMFAVRETNAADNNPEPGRQYLRDTFGQSYWTKREGFVGLLEWLSALGNAEDMNEWADDSEASRILAGRLRNDHG